MTLVMFFLTNKYFYLLLFLIILNTVIKLYDKFPYVKTDNDDETFLQVLHNYYVQNIFYEISILFLYIVAYFGLFLFFRISLLGKKLEIILIQGSGFDGAVIMQSVLFMLCIIFYINIINNLFYPNLVKLHYYFYQYQWYETIIDKCHMNLHFLSEIMRSASALFAKYTWSKKDFDCVLKLRQEADLIMEYENPHRRKFILNKYISQEKLWHIINKNIVFYTFVYFMARCINTFGQISRQLSFISYPLLLLLLLWEIHQGIIHYLYSALLFYFIILWLKRIRYFLTVRDPLEKAITNYFYANEIPYVKISTLRDNNYIIKVYNNIGQNTKMLLSFKEELIPYMLNNFIVYHVRYPTRKANENYLNNDARRSNILILLFLGICYYYINSTKYTLILFDINIKLYLLFIPLTLVLYYISEKMLYDTKKTSEEAGIVWAEHNSYKKLFRILLCIIAIPMLYIMIINKLTLFPKEIILALGDYIKISETYNLEEKRKYLEVYLEIVLKALGIVEQKYKNNIMGHIIIDENTTLCNLRESVEEIILQQFKHNTLKEPLTLLELVHRWWQKLKSILRK